MRTSTQPVTELSRFAMPPRRQAGAVQKNKQQKQHNKTLVGITAMNSTTMQEKMAGNMRDRNTAMQASEAALKTTEAALTALVNKPNEVASCNAMTCVWPRGTAPDLSSQSASWWTS